MELWLHRVSEGSILFLDAVALLFVVAATVGLLAGIAALYVRRFTSGTAPDTNAVRGLWLGHARWLVAALTVQLGADIIESAIAPTWDAIARLGAVAVIRTGLNYFLERDMAEARDVEPRTHGAAGPD